MNALSENLNSINIKEELKNTYRYRIEAHAHTTPVSGCSQIKPEELVRIYKELGYDAVTVTNHFISYMFKEKTKDEALAYYLKDFYDAKSAGEKYGIKVYLGLEVRFQNECMNDYLLYGVDDDITSTVYDYLEYDLAKFRTEVKLDNSVFIQAHPFRDGMKLADPALLDGIETFNLHPGHNSRIGLAVKYANEKSFDIVTAGSDFHHPNVCHEGVAAIRTKTLPKDSFELAKVLKSQDYLLEIVGNSIVFP